MILLLVRRETGGRGRAGLVVGCGGERGLGMWWCGLRRGGRRWEGGGRQGVGSAEIAGTL